MTIIRRGQRALTNVVPHQGNKNIVVPRRGGSSPSAPLNLRLDNPVQNGKEVLDQGTEVFSPQPAASWPAYGFAAQSSANVAGIDTTLSDPLFSSWQRKKDLVFLQGRYPTQSRVQDTYDGVVDMKADNLNLRILEYVYPMRTDDTGQADILGLMWETVEENNGETEWRGVDANSSSNIRDNQGRIFLNPNHEGTDPAGGKLDFAVACADKYQAKSGTGHPSVDLRQAVDGVFNDSLDYKDQFPSQLRDDLTTSANIDYLKPKSSGNTDPALYREGIKYFYAKWREEFGTDQVVSSNGGRDGDAVDDPTSVNEWAGYFDHRLSENFQQKIGLEKKAGVNELETTFSNMDSRMEKGIRSLLISSEMVDKTASNRLGTGLVSIDWVTEWSGGDPTSVASIPQGFYDGGRLICGIAAMDYRLIAGPQLERGTLPWPYMDEFVHDCGDPIGPLPKIGDIDNTDPLLPLTFRTPDKAPEPGSDYGIYCQEFEFGCWVLNLNQVDGLSDYPQAATDSFTMPDPGVGFEWRHFDSTYVNPTRTTGATAAENQSPAINDGSLVGATINIRRWTAEYFVRTPT